MIPQLFCEADTYPPGKCPCVKCQKVMAAAKAFAKARDKHIQQIAMEVFRKHSRLFEKLAPKIVPDRCIPITDEPYMGRNGPLPITGITATLSETCRTQN